MRSIPSRARIPEKPAEILPWLKRLIDDGEAESSSLEFKSGAVLDRDNRKRQAVKDEMSKDASAMANANGGVIIYGIEEAGSGERQAAKGFSPVTDPKVSRETIDQILADHVRPPLQGLRIEEVILPSEESAVGGRCFVVEIPSASIAHQAGDLKYWRRRTITTEAMEHYEIQEVMNRAKHPDVAAKLTVELVHRSNTNSQYVLIIEIENKGKIIARNYCAVVYFPVFWESSLIEILHFHDYPSDRREQKHLGEFCWSWNISNANRDPLFPSHKVSHKIAFSDNSRLNPPVPVRDPDNAAKALAEIRVEVFADEMPARLFTYPAAPTQDQGSQP